MPGSKHQKFILVLVAAIAFEGFRFGAGTFRALMDLPARHALGSLIEEFVFWTNLRILFADLSFLALLACIGRAASLQR